MKHPPTIETRRLLLRPFCLDDAPQVQRLAGAREVARTTLNIAHPYEDGMAERWIASHASGFYDGRLVCLAITDGSDGGLVGAIGLSVTPEHRRAELGYWVGVPYWRRGYCTEAAISILGWGFRELQLRKVSSRHMLDNPASGRVMQKIGMTREGVLRQELLKDGEFHDLVVYGVLASEFETEQHEQSR